MRNNEKGRSMVEMLGVLAIIGVLSAGGLAGYSKAMFKHKLNNTIDQITMLATNIRTMYGTQRSYTGLDNATAIALGIIPTTMIGGSNGSGSGPALVNPFKGRLSIYPRDIGNIDNGSFSIELGGLPKEACIALATMDFGGGAGSGFIAVHYDGSAPSGTYGQANEGKPYSMSQALELCWDNPDGNTLDWQFY